MTDIRIDTDIDIKVISLSASENLFSTRITRDSIGQEAITVFMEDKELFSINNKIDTKRYNKEHYKDVIKDLIELLKTTIEKVKGN